MIIQVYHEKWGFFLAAPGGGGVMLRLVFFFPPPLGIIMVRPCGRILYDHSMYLTKRADRPSNFIT